MDEYIKRDGLLRKFNIDDMMNVNGTLISLHDARETISNFPAADVAPVRHGKWVHSRYENCSEQFEMVKCSCCGREAYAMAFYVRDGNYCPNCGAPITGSVCEYCGTRHETGIMIRCAPASQIFRDSFLLSCRIQQCSKEEIERLQTMLARESVNALDSLINSYERNRNAAQRI
jgi:hypothetical protein